MRSFADGNGDGIGDLAGVRAPPALPGRAGHRRDLVHALVSLADGGRRLRRGRLPRDRAAVRQPGRGGEADRRGARAGYQDDHRRRPEPRLGPAALVHRRAGRRRPARPSGPATIFRPGRGARGELPPNDWTSMFGGPAWTRVAGAGRGPGRVVPAPVHPRPARLQLGAPGCAGRVRQRAAVLVRPRGGRVPYRLGRPAGQGPQAGGPGRDSDPGQLGAGGGVPGPARPPRPRPPGPGRPVRLRPGIPAPVHRPGRGARDLPGVAPDR